MWNPKSGEFEYLPGPVFANILLADEINCTHPAPSLLLEVMEEQQVTVDGVSRKVPSIFFVIATQNPSSIMAHFLTRSADGSLLFDFGYPTEVEELQMLQRLQDGLSVADLQPCITPAELLELRGLCAQVKVENLCNSTFLTWFERRGRMRKLPLCQPAVLWFIQRQPSLAFLDGRLCYSR